jgi:hypothetical protein
MEKTKIFNLFKTFIGSDVIDIEGLYLKPERILKDGRTIEFSIKNPDDLSYYIGIVVEYLDEILFDFSKFTNFKFNYRINTNYTNYPALYLNETLKNDIQTYLNSKKRLRLIGSSRIAVTIDGESLGFWTEFDSDRIFIWNEFEPNSGVAYDLMSKEIISEDLSECIDQYLKIIESDSTYLESDEVYQGLDSILEEHPLISTDWVALVYHTGFTNL